MRVCAAAKKYRDGGQQSAERNIEKAGKKEEFGMRQDLLELATEAIIVRGFKQRSHPVLELGRREPLRLEPGRSAGPGYSRVAVYSFS